MQVPCETSIFAENSRCSETMLDLGDAREETGQRLMDIIRVCVIAKDAKLSYLVAAPPPSYGSVVCSHANSL